MKTVYRNQQDDDDPFNGSTIESEKKLVTLLKRARSGKPLFIRLSFDDGCELLLGIAQGGRLRTAFYFKW